jgi:hypothetical protein
MHCGLGTSIRSLRFKSCMREADGMRTQSRSWTGIAAVVASQGSMRQLATVLVDRAMRRARMTISRPCSMSTRSKLSTSSECVTWKNTGG